MPQFNDWLTQIILITLLTIFVVESNARKKQKPKSENKKVLKIIFIEQFMLNLNGNKRSVPKENQEKSPVKKWWNSRHAVVTWSVVAESKNWQIRTNLIRHWNCKRVFHFYVCIMKNVSNYLQRNEKTQIV